LDDGGLFSLLVIFLSAYALMTLIYTAITNVRQATVREQLEQGRARAQRVQAVVDDLVRFNLTYQVTLLLLHVILASLTFLALVPAVLATGAAPIVAYVGVLAGLVLVVLLFGHLLPTSLGSAYADTLALALSGLARWWMLLFAPITLTIIAVSGVLGRLLGGDSVAVSVTEEEIMTLVDAGQKEGTIDDEEKAMIYSVLQFSETMVREVMVPRMDIVALEINTPLQTAIQTFIETGHSRIPLYDERIDNVEGLLYAKDLLTQLYQNNGEQTIRELMRPAYFVPESKRADLVLKELQHSKIHLAVVVDEYGGTAGIVSIENLVEEIVGDIQDEYDLYEEAEYTQLSEHEYTFDASIDLDDFNALLNVDLPTDDHDTLGGYIYARVGRVPVVDETIHDEEHGLLVRVQSVEGRRIRKVHVTRQQETDKNGSDVPEMSDETG
jgi:putative hemolysin